MLLSASEEPTQLPSVPASLANTDADISGLVPASIVIENKLRFTGDNSGFTVGTTTIGSGDAPADVEYAGSKSAFQTETTVTEGSKLTISTPEGVTLKKDLTVQGGSGGFSLNEEQDEIIGGSGGPGGKLVIKGKLTIGNGAKLRLGTGGSGSGGAVAESPSQYPKVMSWPVGSFSTPLTEFYKVYYNVTLDDETTNVEIYYDEQAKYWQATSSGGDYYEADYYDGELTISNVMGGGNKTLTAAEMQALVSTKKELILANDDLFSFTKDESGNWVRRTQYMVFQPGTVDPASMTDDDPTTWKILDLGSNKFSYDGTYEGTYGTEITHAVVFSYSNDESWKLCACYLSGKTIMNRGWVGYTKGLGGIEGNTQPLGLWSRYVSPFGGTHPDSNMAKYIHNTLKSGGTWKTISEYEGLSLGFSS